MTLLLSFLIVCMFPAWAVGMVTFIQWYRGKNDSWPVDKSNIINMVRLWWYALTRPEKFVSIFPWLTKDEGDNLP